MAIGFVRCSECDVEMRPAEAVRHRTPEGSTVFFEACAREQREADDCESDG